MPTDNKILLGHSHTADETAPLIYLEAKRANRHGLIAGATGTGKTVSLQAMAESFSQMGVPVFLSDVKGDLSGITQAGGGNSKVIERFELMNLPLDHWCGAPSVIWDVMGEQGHPIRATISDMGPLLLARLLDLNETQEGILTVAFAVADDQGMLLLDLQDLRATLQHISDNRKELRAMYGNISPVSVGAIQRKLLVMERDGAEQFFGEPMLDINDLLRCNSEGHGYVNILAANKLIQTPKIYSTFLLWLLAELFENLPEVGDPDKPKLVFFFDEAHLLFKDAPKALIAKIEQVVRLIRSKGVGVYFVTQSPSDIPDVVLAQLGNRIQHALRAFTPKEQKAVRTAADTFRANKTFDTRTAITELVVGEALVSTLLKNGAPSVVQRILIKPPFSRIGPATQAELSAVRNQSPLKGVYEEPINRQSAYEILTQRADAMTAEAEQQKNRRSRVETPPKKRSNRQSAGEAFLKSMARSIGSQVGRRVIRGILGSLFKGR